MRLFIIISLTILIFSSCEDPLEGQTDVPGDLIETTQKLFPGEIIEQGATKVDDIDVWKIKIKNSSNAITTFYWRKAFSNLFKIVGEQGPFDYDIKPPFDVINFSTAKFLAFNQNGSETINYWEYLRSPVEMKWYYHFFTNDSEIPIVIDAGSGEVVR